jgi:hypothetical protein
MTVWQDQTRTTNPKSPFDDERLIKKLEKYGISIEELKEAVKQKNNEKIAGIFLVPIEKMLNEYGISSVEEFIENLKGEKSCQK